MRSRPQLFLEGVCDYVFHIGQFLLQVFQLSIIATNSLLIGSVFAHERLLFDLNLLQLLCELASKGLQLSSIVHVLLQLVAYDLTVFLCNLFLLKQFPLQLPQVLEFLLLLLMFLSLFIISYFCCDEFLLKLFLKSFSLRPLFQGLLQLLLIFKRFGPEGVDLIRDLNQLSP